MKKTLATILFLLAGSSQAVIIDFQDVTSGSCQPSGFSMTSRGFDFTGNPSDPSLYVCDAGVIANNTSAALINANSTSIIMMTASDSSLFSLQSFFAGGRTEEFDTSSISSIYGLSTGIEIVGTLFDSSTVTETVTFEFLNWEQFNLSNSFENLTSVTFTALGTGASPEFVIDDIVVNESVGVSEPTSIALLGLSLAGLFFSRKKMQA